MAASQDARNVLYLFYRRKILSCPQRKPCTQVLMPAPGRLHQRRCTQIIHMSIHLPPRSICYPGLLLHVNEPATEPALRACCQLWMSGAGREARVPVEVAVRVRPRQRRVLGQRSQGIAGCARTAGCLERVCAPSDSNESQARVS